MARISTLAMLCVLIASLVAGPLAAEEPPLNRVVANFRLPDAVTGNPVQLSDYRDRLVVVIFYSHTCTFCRNYEARVRQFAADQAGKGVTVLAIDSTASKPQEAAAAWQEKKMGFPLLRDDRARTAASLGAMNLTTVCVLDGRGHLRYIGAFDDCESGREVRTPFVADAVAALRAGKPLPRQQTEVYGCLIPLPE